MTSVASTPTPASGPQAPRRTRGHVTTYGVGRICADSECGTTLSRYNDAEFCWYHVAVIQASQGRIRP